MTTIEQIKRLIERVKNTNDVQTVNDDDKLNYGDVYDFDWDSVRNDVDTAELLQDTLEEEEQT